ncbi:MAG: 23S rRNA pseudouridine(2604) synthase RluF [Saprospiraceae bacterium]|nr:23S rRNA pseudouridine(2604) synthase RluF [Saprospiraceae bacterium]
MDSHNEDSISLNKFISSRGICSRREADKLIQSGKVTINGKIASLGNRVIQGDHVKVNGKLIKPKPKPVYILLNKPVGLVSTTDKRESRNIVDFINYPQRLFPVGRLDAASQGLILLTNDGDIVNKILRAGNNHEKEYIVTVNKKINQDFLKRMSGGVRILGQLTKKCKVRYVNDRTFRIILVQGLNRQIRRMCEALGYKVSSLNRIRIMNLKTSKLKPGQWRKLTPDELKGLNLMVVNSTKTEEGSRYKGKKSTKHRKK